MISRQHKLSMLIWYTIACAELLVFSIAAFLEFHYQLWDNDQTKLSFLILLLWVVATVLIGVWHTVEIPKTKLNELAKIGWYISEVCVAVGMIGTVAGFLIMLGAAFSNIDVSNVASMQAALTYMASGMSTALYTTLVGLVCSVFIKTQLVNLEHFINGLE